MGFRETNAMKVTEAVLTPRYETGSLLPRTTAFMRTLSHTSKACRNFISQDCNSGFLFQGIVSRAEKSPSPHASISASGVTFAQHCSGWIPFCTGNVSLQPSPFSISVSQAHVPLPARRLLICTMTGCYKNSVGSLCTNHSREQQRFLL